MALLKGREPMIQAMINPQFPGLFEQLKPFAHSFETGSAIANVLDQIRERTGIGHQHVVGQRA